MVLSKSLI